MSAIEHLVPNPVDSYWAADDGRIFATGRGQLVAPDDAALNVWMSLYGNPLPWPVDASGQQTDASLQGVLTAFGLFCSLEAYAIDHLRRAIVDGVDGSISMLNASQIIAASGAVLAHVQACFTAYAAVSAGVAASPPTITTRTQVDAAFAALG